MKKIFAKLIALGLCAMMAVPCVNAKADSTQKYLALGASLSASEQKKVLDRSLFDVVHLVELVPQADGVLVKAKTEWK